LLSIARALTAANILAFLFAFVVQYVFGVAVHYRHRLSGSDISGGFKAGLTALVVLELIALLRFVVYRTSSKPESS